MSWSDHAFYARTLLRVWAVWGSVVAAGLCGPSMRTESGHHLQVFLSPGPDGPQAWSWWVNVTHQDREGVVTLFLGRDDGQVAAELARLLSEPGTMRAMRRLMA
jgi:hypothetical protein